MRQLWRAPADATYEEVFEAAYEALKRNRFQQDPVMSEDVPLKGWISEHLGADAVTIMPRVIHPIGGV